MLISSARYVPGTGELCEFLDCGGGRAPPKTTVPGCAQYSGTETYSPSYLAGYGSATASPTASAATSATTSAVASSSASAASSITSSSSFDWDAAETDTAMTSFDLYTTLASLGPGVYDTTSRFNVSGTAAATGNGTAPTGATGGKNGTAPGGSATSSSVEAPAATDNGATRAGFGAVLALGALVFAL